MFFSCISCEHYPTTHTFCSQESVIAKHWGGVLQEFFTDADTFSATFPMAMPVKIKALILGAVFVIDQYQFEKSN